MKPVIIAIVGGSGTGKTFLANYLSRQLGIPQIISYTTRPPREGERHGRDYFFITPHEVPPHEQMLTYTRYGGCEYFARLDQVPARGRCIYVLDERGLAALREQYRDRFRIAAVLVRSTPEALRRRGIPPERLARDSGRRSLSLRSYDAMIDNNGDDLRTFGEEALHIIKQLG